jgi:uncharacterized protein YjiS (DUF1127 family)
LRQIKGNCGIFRQIGIKGHLTETKMLERLWAIFDYWHELKEVAALSDRDLDDLGMTRSQMESFARMPRDVPERMKHMAEIFGLTEAEIKRHYGEYLDMVETCAHCGSRRNCTHVLENAETTAPEDCGFCPNSDLYARKFARKVADATV